MLTKEKEQVKIEAAGDGSITGGVYRNENGQLVLKVKVLTPRMLCHWEAYKNVSLTFYKEVVGKPVAYLWQDFFNKMACLHAVCTGEYPEGHVLPNKDFEDEIRTAFKTELKRLYPNDQRFND